MTTTIPPPTSRGPGSCSGGRPVEAVKRETAELEYARAVYERRSMVIGFSGTLMAAVVGMGAAWYVGTTKPQEVGPPPTTAPSAVVPTMSSPTAITTSNSEPPWYPIGDDTATKELGEPCAREVSAHAGTQAVLFQRHLTTNWHVLTCEAGGNHYIYVEHRADRAKRGLFDVSGTGSTTYVGLAAGQEIEISPEIMRTFIDGRTFVVEPVVFRRPATVRPLGG